MKQLSNLKHTKASNPTVNRMLGFKNSKTQREKERDTERERKQRIYQCLHRLPMERALCEGLPLPGPDCQPWQEERQPHGERMKGRAREDADKVGRRTGCLESVGASSSEGLKGLWSSKGESFTGVASED